MDKRKTGIALFITLMVIASIMSIIAVSFSYLEKARTDASAVSGLIQANILYGNTSDVLKRFFPKGSKDSKKLNLLYTLPLTLAEEESGFMLNMQCKALITAVPINWLDEEKFSSVPDKSSLAKDILLYVVDFYNIEDPNGLEEMLLEAITGKTLENRDYEPRLDKQRGIVSKNQFMSIITNYSLQYNDKKALNIPWEKYFTFIEVSQKTLIDGGYPSAEFISAAFDIPLELIKDNWVNDIKSGEVTTLSSFLKDNDYISPLNKKIYSTKAVNAMHCKQIFIYNENQYGFQFNYIEGRSSNFEFNGQE